MSDKDVARIKHEGAKKALYEACANALHAAKISCEFAPRDGFKDAKNQIEQAKRNLQAAEEFLDAAKERARDR